MINNMWYAILPSSKVKVDKICGVTRMGLQLALFRNKDGKIACVSDKCTHRGASLSKGKVTNGCITCPFHALQFSKDGQCVYIPANGKANQINNERYNIKSYTVEELAGIIFLWYGDAEPVGHPTFFEDLLEGFSFSELEDKWNTHYSRAIENQLDVVHVPIVHHNTIGRGNKTLINGPKVIFEDKYIITSANNELDIGQKPKKQEDCVIKSTYLKFKYPNLWMNHISKQLRVVIYFAPVDNENTILYIRFYSSLTKVKLINNFICFVGRILNKIIERQDKRVVETQTPKISTYKGTEKLLSGDAPIIQYRKIRDELINKNV